jgi:hypothetical protein
MPAGSPLTVNWTAPQKQLPLNVDMSFPFDDGFEAILEEPTLHARRYRRMSPAYRGGNSAAG